MWCDKSYYLGVLPLRGAGSAPFWPRLHPRLAGGTSLSSRYLSLLGRGGVKPSSASPCMIGDIKQRQMTPVNPSIVLRSPSNNATWCSMEMQTTSPSRIDLRCYVREGDLWGGTERSIRESLYFTIFERERCKEWMICEWEWGRCESESERDEMRGCAKERNLPQREMRSRMGLTKWKPRPSCLYSHPWHVSGADESCSAPSGWSMLLYTARGEVDGARVARKSPVALPYKLICSIEQLSIWVRWMNFHIFYEWEVAMLYNDFKGIHYLLISRYLSIDLLAFL